MDFESSEFWLTKGRKLTRNPLKGHRPMPPWRPGFQPYGDSPPRIGVRRTHVGIPEVAPIYPKASNIKPWLSWPKWPEWPKWPRWNKWACAKIVRAAESSHGAFEAGVVAVAGIGAASKLRRGK